MGGCLVSGPDSHQYRVKKDQCRIDTVSSPDDGHTVTNQQTRKPPIHSEKYQYHIDTVSSPDDGHIVAEKCREV